MIAATLTTPLVPEVRARMFGCRRAIPVVPTRLVRFQPTASLIDHVCEGIDQRARLSVLAAFANEMYELSNAPFRQEQREKVWGANRSLSVGDIVELDFNDGEKWMAVCQAAGWAFKKLDQALIDQLDAAATMFDREDIVRDLKSDSFIS